nr:hypothetical protein [uncultured Sphaerochaeta sp.]
MNRNSTKQLVVLMIIAFTTMTTLFATDRCEYLSPRIYLGINYGHSVVEKQEVPNVGVTVGSKLSSRTSTEIFAKIEPLSNFPGEDFGVDITETEATFAFSSGLAVTTRMFHDAAFNPFVQAGIGTMAIGHLISEDDEYVMSNLEYVMHGTIATGLEVNIFQGVSVQFVHGYRYIPHRRILDIEPHTLSGSFNSVAFKAYLD